MRSTSNIAMLALSAGAANAQLNKLAVAAGLKYFGSATDNGELTNTSYTAILSDSDEFGQITPGNTQKWYYTEPEEGTFDYTEGDVVVDFAQNNSQIVRCHNLVWYSQLPSWISSDTWTNETLTSAMTTHITNEVTHYKGQCYAWDVVNEALSDSGGYRDSPFYTTIGEYYIPIAFAAAAAADPDAKMYYNDYNIEYTGTKLTEALAIVDLIQGAGVQIDGVGLQGHFVVGSTNTADEYADVLSQFTAKGVEVAYTELDIRHPSLPPTTDQIEEQAVGYAAVVQACLQTDGCVGVTVWDFDDYYSWVPSTFSGAGQACIYDENLSKKPAWTSISSVLAGAATGGVASTSASSTAVAAVASATGASAPAYTAAASGIVASGSSGPMIPVSGSAAYTSAPVATSAAALPTSSAGSCTKKTKTVWVTASL
ncbi:hypothetical protein N0V82_005172 [Gnomoniopsis sp. IMI 355080]|nr:hypothetical protein N0V82_005172 [Gnomoniopsis sp. IMI 355080]